MEETKNIEIGNDEKLVYELAFHILPTVGEEEVAAAASRVRALAEKQGAQVIHEEAPKLRELTYEMTKDSAGKLQRFSSAYFGWLTFDLPRGTIGAIKEGVDAEEKVLRSLILKIDREEATPRSAQSAPIKRKLEDENKDEEVSEEELDKTINELVA